MTPLPQRAPNWTAVTLLGIAHGLGDFNAGLLLANLGLSSGSDLVVTYLVYNVLAFLGQPLAGLICDKIGRPISWFYFGGGLSAFAIFLAHVSPLLAVVLSGMASAFYHSSGGAAAWKIGQQRTLAAGIFSAPGVIGLALGMASGGQSNSTLFFASGTALVLLLALLYFFARKDSDDSAASPSPLALGKNLLGGLLGWLIVLSIAARSFAWTIGQKEIFPPEYAVWLALSAAVGKYLAAALADKLGAGLVTVLSLLLAAAFLVAGRSWPILFFPAVTAMQAGTAPMMALVLRAWPRNLAFGSGLAQGLAVAVGGAPLILLSQLESIPFFSAVAALIVAATIMLFVDRTKATISS